MKSTHYDGSLAARRKKFFLLALYDEYALGLRILTSLLLDAGHDVRLVMFKKFSLTIRTDPTETEWELLHQAIKDFAPDFIGVSMLSIPVIDERRLFNTVRSAAPQAVVVCGGFGPTLEPMRFLAFGPDYIVRGEGEKAILAMATALEEGRDLKKSPNLAWLENGRLIQNPLAEQTDLACIPVAIHGKKHILYIDGDIAQHIDPMLDSRGIYLTSTSRGCTSRCTYCAGGNWLDLYRDEQGTCKRYRKRPIGNVIEECVQAKAAGATYILFLDEFFVRPEAEYFRFFKEYRDRVGLPFGLMVHTAFMEKDDARFDIFVNAGVHDVEIGVQSASPHVAVDIFHRPVSFDTQLRTIQKLYERWVSVAVDFITGHSLEREEDFLETVDFVAKLPFDPSWPMRCHLEVFNLGLLPGAKIGELYPLLKNDPMPATEKEFRQRILYLRHILKDDDAFWAIYHNRTFREKPRLLKNVFNITYSQCNALFWQRTLARLEGKNVYFWGAGQSYQIYKHLFRHTKPQGIILDKGKSADTIDGLPVLSPDDALGDTGGIPLIVFSSAPGIIATKVLCSYPAYSDIIPCYDASYQQLFLA